MKKALLLITAILFFTRCNNLREQKPNAEPVVKDTFTQNVMQPFNNTPQARYFYVRVHPKDENVLRAQQPGILHLLEAMKSQPQRFSINPSEKNELQGEYGTKIFFEPDCFLAESGQEISSPVQIELKECYTMEEMLEENLTTTCKNKILESKGAVFVSATCNGQELKLKEGQKINIEFPFAVNDKYRFFYGVTGASGINWSPVPEEEEETAVLASKINLTKPEFSYKGYDLNDYLASQLEYPDEAKRNELSADVEVTFTVDKGGKVHDVTCGSAYKTFRDEIISTVQQMPKWKPATYGKKKISAQIKLNIDFNLRRKDQIQVNYNSGDVVPVGTAKNIISDDKNSSNAVCSGTFDRLGWINCSRFSDQTGIKADVIVRSDANTEVKIIVKNRNSIICGQNCVGYSRFKNLPANAEVYVMAIRTEAGNIFYSFQPVKLEKQTVVSLMWTAGDKEAIEKMYRSISS